MDATNDMMLETQETDAGLVSVIDDDVDICRALEMTLRSVGYRVQSFHNPEDFLVNMTVQTPGAPMVVLVDFLLPRQTGLWLCQELVARNVQCKFVVITGHADVPFAVEAMKLGAVDLLEKPISRQRLLEVVKKAMDLTISTSKSRVEKTQAFEKLRLLTHREREILTAIAQGSGTKAIAKRLGISPRTVDVHRSRIMQKLVIDSPMELVNFLVICREEFL